MNEKVSKMSKILKRNAMLEKKASITIATIAMTSPSRIVLLEGWVNCDQLGL
jgi:hypothetical protein